MNAGAEWGISFTINRIVEDGDRGLMRGALDLVTTVSSAVPIALACSAGSSNDIRAASAPNRSWSRSPTRPVRRSPKRPR